MKDNSLKLSKAGKLEAEQRENFRKTLKLREKQIKENTLVLKK